MSYEIPQQLQYKEKIIFGLTFGQLGYALLFLPVVLFLLLKTGFSLPSRVMFALIPATAACLLMFTGSAHFLRNIICWQRNRTVMMEETRVPALAIEPVNFSLYTYQEKEYLIRSFQRFLNGIDFQVQVFIKTEELSLDEYLDAVRTGHELFAGFETYLRSTVKGIFNRRFYLIVPAEKSSLCENMMKQMSLSCHTEEITLPAQNWQNHPREMQADGQWCRTIAVTGYPRRVEEGFLNRLIVLNGNCDFSLFIEPFPMEQMIVTLNRQLQKQQADLWSLQRKGMLNPSLEIQYKDTLAVLENIQKGEERLFNLSVYITCKAPTRQELDVLCTTLVTELHPLLMLSSSLSYQQHTALRSALPLVDNRLGVQRNIPTRALSAFFPFTSQFLSPDPKGVLFGVNRQNIPLIKDIFSLPNANGVVLASSGGGKSYFTKLLIARLLMSGIKVIVIDPQGEYLGLAERFQGEIVAISQDSALNPLDLMGHSIAEKKLTLLDLFSLMLGQLSEIQKAVLDRALTEVYGRKQNPVMGDLLEQLKGMSRYATRLEIETYRSLINRTEMYVSGVFSFLNRQTSLDFNNRFVCFNLGDMPSQVKPAIMFLILDFCYMKMKKDSEKKLLVIDEAWSLLQRAEDEGYVFSIVKTCRKFNLGLLLITQDVMDLLNNRAGEALLNNSEYTVLLRQKPVVMDDVVRMFHLSGAERDRLLTAGQGEGILIISNAHSEITVIASPEEHAAITSTVHLSFPEIGKGIFTKSSLTPKEVEMLLEYGYRLSVHADLLGRAQEYLLKPRYNESCEHFFLVKVLEEFIRKYTPVELFVTGNADIVFAWKGKNLAVEVETGSRGMSRVRQKVSLLNTRFNKWLFVVANAKDKQKYAALGPTCLRTEAAKVLRRWVR